MGDRTSDKREAPEPGEPVRSKGEGMDALPSEPPEPQASDLPPNPLAAILGGPGGIELDAPDAEPADDFDDELIVDINAPDEAAIKAHDDAIAKRGDAVWYAVVGIAMLFMSSFHWGIAVGGVLMVVYGTVRYTYFSKLAKSAYDPWDDDDLDSWEARQMEDSP